MVFLTLMIGVLNVCLGYALAVYLGYGPPGLPETWQALSVGSPVQGQAEAFDEAAEGLVEELAVGASEDAEETLKPQPNSPPQTERMVPQ
jgi:hypothetical protein